MQSNDERESTVKQASSETVDIKSDDDEIQYSHTVTRLERVRLQGQTPKLFKQVQTELIKMLAEQSRALAGRKSTTLQDRLDGKRLQVSRARYFRHYRVPQIIGTLRDAAKALKKDLDWMEETMDGMPTDAGRQVFLQNHVRPAQERHADIQKAIEWCGFLHRDMKQLLGGRSVQRRVKDEPEPEPCS